MSGLEMSEIREPPPHHHSASDSRVMNSFYCLPVATGTTDKETIELSAQYTAKS